MTTKLINLTNLVIKVRNDHGVIRTFNPTSFTPVYRIEPFMIRRAVPYIDSYRADAAKKIEIINLPVYDPLVAYICSIEMLVMVCGMNRFDFFSPDYKNHPLRDETTNEVIGVTRFITLAEPGIDGFMNPPFLNAGYPPPQGPCSYDDVVQDTPPPGP